MAVGALPLGESFSLVEARAQIPRVDEGRPVGVPGGVVRHDVHAGECKPGWPAVCYGLS